MMRPNLLEKDEQRLVLDERAFIPPGADLATFKIVHKNKTKQQQRRQAAHWRDMNEMAWGEWVKDKHKQKLLVRAESKRT